MAAVTNNEAIAKALDEGRRAAGLSYSAVVRELYDKLGTYALGTVEGVRNYHRPATFPARPDLIQINALTEIYLSHGVRFSEPSRVVLASVRTFLAELLEDGSHVVSQRAA